MTPAPDDTPDDDLTADLYVLGLLDEADRVEAERRLARDPGFAGRVSAASRRFAALDDTALPVPLPRGAWERLEQRLAAAPEPTGLASAPVSTPVSTPVSAPKSAPVSAPPAANATWAPWRAALAVAAVLLLALGLSWPPLRGGAENPDAVAVLLDPEGAPFALIEDFGEGEAAVTTLAAFEVPEGRSLQVWTKWSEEVGPVSLGVLDAYAGAAVGAEGLPRPVAGQLYEITLEAAGGSATGRPTGPILGLGRAAIPG
jgi:anti-sigma-K factor RskA